MLGIRRTQICGAALLLLVLVAAQVVSAIQGNWTTHLLQYAASTLFIVLLDRALHSGRGSSDPDATTVRR